MTHGLIPVLAVIFFATFVRSTLGFGEALLGVPLLALFMPLRVAVPVMVLISITVSTVVLLQDWRHVHLRSAGWLVAQRFRATLQGCFLPASLASMLGYGLTGLWTAAVTRDYLTALPTVPGAILLGRAVHGRLHAHAFLRAVNRGLLAIALLLLGQSLHAIL